MKSYRPRSRLSRVVTSPRFPPQPGSHLAMTDGALRSSMKQIVRQKKEDMDSRKILPGNITEIFTLGSKNSLTKHFDSRFPR